MEVRVVPPRDWQIEYGIVPATEVAGARRMLFSSGHLAVDDDGRPTHPDDMRAQIGAALDGLEATLAEAGFALGDIVRLTWNTTDVDRLLEAADVYLPRLAAARCRCVTSLLGVSRLTFPESLVEIAVLAMD